MSRNFPQAKVTRPNTLRLYDEITSGAPKVITSVGKYIGKEIGKDQLSELPKIGGAIGGALGTELGPAGVAGGAWIGQKLGGLAKKELSSEIDKL